MIKYKHVTTGLAALISGMLASAALATPAVIEDGFVQAGVSDYGTLGSNGDTSPGILYDPTGSANYGINDFLTPGDPFEGFYITSNQGSAYSNNEGVSNFTTHSPSALSGTSATWTGHAGPFEVTHTYSLTTISGRSVIAIDTILKNISGSTVNNIQFLRTLDPDPDHNAYGTYMTQNTLISDDQACATGTRTGQTICIYSFDSLFHKAGISSTWTTDPADYLAGLNDGDGDYAIGIAFDIGDLGDGEFVDLSYGYALGGSLSNASGSVPEPSTLLLLGLGALGLGATRRLRAPA